MCKMLYYSLIWSICSAHKSHDNMVISTKRHARNGWSSWSHIYIYYIINCIIYYYRIYINPPFLQFVSKTCEPESISCADFVILFLFKIEITATNNDDRVFYISIHVHQKHRSCDSVYDIEFDIILKIHNQGLILKYKEIFHLNKNFSLKVEPKFISQQFGWYIIYG